ncbi:BrnT family toxin [bacterium]|nr:BrnT family toxin [bacterium]
MEFEWDEAKNQVNKAKRGIDFKDAKQVFDGRTISFIDHRFDYGKEREVTLGMLGEMVVVIVHTTRGEKIRIISMRKARPRERRFYEEEVFL